MVVGVKVLNGEDDVLGEVDGAEGGENESTGEGGEGGAKVEENECCVMVAGGGG